MTEFCKFLKNWSLSFFMISAAPTKFVPLSEYIHDGLPRLPTKRENAARNDWVDKSLVASKCMAFVAKQTKTQTYPLVIRQALPVKFFMLNGPAKSTPVLLKGVNVRFFLGARMPLFVFVIGFCIIRMVCSCG